MNHESHPEVSGTDDVQQNSVDQEQCREAAAPPHTDGDFPGSSATYRILEVRDALFFENSYKDFF